MNSYFEQLMKLKGADQLQKLVKKWDVLSENITKRAPDAPIVLPDILLYTKPGCGNTRIFHLLSEYLNSKENLMAFYGDVKFFEFKLEYYPKNDIFRDLYRLIESIQTAAGFRNVYKGIIRINIDEWVGHHNEKHFLDFLQFLQFNTGYWLVVLTLSEHEEDEKTKEMESVISMYLRLEKITVKMPENKDLAEYAQNHFSNYGFELDGPAMETLEKSIAVLRKNKYFYGYNTVIDMCNDIVYSLFSKETMADKIITAEMLTDFSEDSDYVKRTVIKLEKKDSIGF